MFDYKQRPWSRPLTDAEYARAVGKPAKSAPTPKTKRPKSVAPSEAVLTKAVIAQVLSCATTFCFISKQYDPSTWVVVHASDCPRSVYAA